MTEIPQELHYTQDHEWAVERDGFIEVGITQYAVDQLGDVTLVDLPAVGTTLELRKRFGDIESVKTVSELFAPVAGVVAEINEALFAKPELVNESPYSQGWMVRIRPSSTGALQSLMDASTYAAHLGTLDH